jgi:hypothetical protein
MTMHVPRQEVRRPATDDAVAERISALIATMRAGLQPAHAERLDELLAAHELEVALAMAVEWFADEGHELDERTRAEVIGAARIAGVEDRVRTALEPA